MSKTPDPVEVVRDKVVPAAEELVASVAERVAPLAREAVDQMGPVASTAADATVALVHAAAEKVGPLTHQAVEAVTPLAQQTREAVAPYAQTAADRVGPLAHSAAGAVAPFAALAAERGRQAGHDLAERLEPAYGAAVEALSGAKDKVQTDVLPAVTAAASTAAASPLVAAAAERGRSAVSAARGSTPVVAPPPKKRRGRWVAVLAVVAAAAGATYVAVRRLTGDQGSQWQTARPTTPYVPPTSAAAAAQARPDPDSGEGHAGPRSAHQVYAAADGDAQPDQPAEGGDDVTTSTSSTIAGTAAGSAEAAGDPGGSADDDRDASADRVEETNQVAASDEGDVSPSITHEDTGSSTEDDLSGASAGTSGDSAPSDEPRSPYGDERLATELETVEERAYEEPDDAVTVEQDTATGIGPDAHPGRYDDIAGVYLGVEPPAGYAIKGNERSMKYHLPDSNSYARTIAEVWFDSEEAAQQAGFTRAQH